jgi:hypothetical protein
MNRRRMLSEEGGLTFIMAKSEFRQSVVIRFKLK